MGFLSGLDDSKSSKRLVAVLSFAVLVIVCFSAIVYNFMNNEPMLSWDSLLYTFGGIVGSAFGFGVWEKIKKDDKGDNSKSSSSN